MTPTNVTGISQTAPLVQTAKSNPTHRQETVTSQKATAVSTKERSLSFDTVSISQQSRQATNSVKKDESKKKDETQPNDNKANNSQQFSSTKPHVKFAYDVKGNLITNYMDSNNNLIYQVPSKLNLYMQEALAKSGSSVDTKA